MANCPSTPHSRPSYGGFLNAVEKWHLPTDAFNSRESVLLTIKEKINFTLQKIICDGGLVLPFSFLKKFPQSKKEVHYENQ
jgi:hypothetical protein